MINYYLLTKPGIVLGNLVTVAAGFLLASKGEVHLGLFMATLIGLAFIMASACVFNNYIDRQVDRTMERTKDRALVRGVISGHQAILFAVALGLLGTWVLFFFTNLLTLFVAGIGFFVYVILYSFWKCRTIYGTAIGSIAGAVPPVVGYCAVSNQFDLGALIFFAMMVLWQMPHFFSIVAYHLDDYTAAQIPALPIKKGMFRTKIHMFIYIFFFILTAALLTLFSYTGYIYLGVASSLGVLWLLLCLKGFFKQTQDQIWGRQMFRLSLLLITAICVTIPFDIAGEAVRIASYGVWESPIIPEKFAVGSAYTCNMLVDGDYTYFCEMRPGNQGRHSIVRRNPEGTYEDVTPPDFNVQTFVHEYGGGAFTVADGVIYASNSDDGAIYIIRPNETPQRLTEGKQPLSHGLWKETRFADLQHTACGLVAIGEHHEPERSVDNFLALIDLNSGCWKKLASGYDFYSSPAISADGKKIAWICWNHPEMPWTNTELWIAELSEKGELSNLQQIDADCLQSFFQPQWSPNGTLYYMTDRDCGWWNLHRYQNEEVENVCPMEAETAKPLWCFGRSTYAFLGDDLFFAYTQDGMWNLAVLNTRTGSYQTIESNKALIYQVRSGSSCVQFLENDSTSNEALIQIDQHRQLRVLDSTTPDLELGYIVEPKHLSFPSHDRKAYGFYYAPKNPYYRAPVSEQSPLIVMIHGGPTSQATASFSYEKLFWTSRGFAVLDVNYGGSTGYGRAYRSLLDGNFGIVDIEDCVNGALFLADQNLVDRNKMAIRGKSSGGYTTLAALAFKNVFKAGASYYGIADLIALARDTHKFEQRYIEQLIGSPLEERSIWESRSPIHAISHIHVPLILFQGEEDPIVPKNQSIRIYEALQQQGIPVDIHIYSGEQHGFRQAKHIIDSLNRELAFYLKVFHIE